MAALLPWECRPRDPAGFPPGPDTQSLPARKVPKALYRPSLHRTDGATVRSGAKEAWRGQRPAPRTGTAESLALRTWGEVSGLLPQGHTGGWERRGQGPTESAQVTCLGSHMPMEPGLRGRLAGTQRVHSEEPPEDSALSKGRAPRCAGCCCHLEAALRVSRQGRPRPQGGGGAHGSRVTVPPGAAEADTGPWNWPPMSCRVS